MEESLDSQLRKAVIRGDIRTVEELIISGADVNSRHSGNGWTPLHWAVERNDIHIVNLLIRCGANKDIPSLTGEMPIDFARGSRMRVALNMAPDIENQRQNGNDLSFIAGIHEANKNNKSKEEISNNVPHQDELVLKIRVADDADPDFIEVELPKYCLTFSNLVEVCCNELVIDPSHIMRFRKLPNTIIRKDKDVQRLNEFQEIEIVVKTPPDCDATVSENAQVNGGTRLNNLANNYQSISKKDQTILY